MVASWSLGPLVEALRGLRGIDLVSAATFIASTGDLSRFESTRLLMGYLGLVPSEHSSGGTIRRGGITKTGNREARRMLIEAAWSYQYPARIAKEKAEILVRLPKNIRDITWKAQTRLRTRYRSMIARGKKPTVGCHDDPHLLTDGPDEAGKPLHGNNSVDLRDDRGRTAQTLTRLTPLKAGTLHLLLYVTPMLYMDGVGRPY